MQKRRPNIRRPSELRIQFGQLTAKTILDTHSVGIGTQTRI